MLLSAHRLCILLICIGLLAVQQVKISGLRSIDLALKWSKKDHGVVPMNQHMLKEVAMVNLNREKKPATVNKKLDPNQFSKRRVRRGSDPIHNRS
nr:clavata3/endosperm 45 [Panax ginseng]